MLYEFRIAADTAQELREALVAVIGGLGPQQVLAVAANGGPATGLKAGRRASNPAPTKDAPATVDAPDGTTVAEMTQSPFSNEPPVPEASPDLTPAEQRDRAIALLMQAFAITGGPAKVKSLQRQLKISKFTETRDEDCPALLAEAEKILASLTPQQVKPEDE
jgi:hypothetical protein